MSAFCGQCGAALGEGANYCAACGTKVESRATHDELTATESSDAPSVAQSSTSEPRRKSRKRWLYVIAGVIVIPVVIGIIAAAASGSKDVSAPTSAVAHKCAFYPGTKPKPQTCISSEGLPCYDYTKLYKPHNCLSVAQLAAQKRAKKRAAAQARAAAAVAAKAAAAANAWHRGYNEQSGSVFWKWKDGASCQEFAQYGCWHVVVITKFGCPSYVAVNANEYQGNSIIGQLLDNQGYGIPPKTPRIFELDADTGAHVTAGNISIDCE